MKIRNVEIDCKASAINLAVWERMALVMYDESLDTIQKYEKLLNLVGFKAGLIEDLTFDEFGKAIEEFNTETTTDFAVYVTEFEIEGYKYEVFDNLKVKDLRIISKAMNENPVSAGEMMAMCFKRTDLTDKEHYTDAHIKHKAALFRKHLTADVCIPYITKVTDLMVKQVSEQSNDTPTEVVE
jgi:hypothetical protein